MSNAAWPIEHPPVEKLRVFPGKDWNHIRKTRIGTTPEFVAVISSLVRARQL